MGLDDFRISSQSLGSVQQQPKPVPALASQRSPRFYYWLAFFLFSLIVTGSSIEATDRIQPTSQGVTNQQWAVICSILSFCVSLGVVAMHFSPVLAVILTGSRLEGAVCFIMVALWSSLVAVISGSHNGLAVDNEGSVAFGNLYYSGWGGFVCAILLLLNYLKESFSLSINEELSLRSDRLNMWVGYLIVSIILTATAANIYDHECLGSDRFGTKFCNRSLLALVDGGTGAAASIVVIGMKFATGVAPWGIELLFSGCLFLSNCFSIGLVTAEDGPGAKIGNLYYFSWFNLILPFIIMSGTIDYISKRNEQDQKDYAIDIYEEQPATESLDAFSKPKMLSDRYPSEAASIAPTEFSEGVESYSLAQQEGRTQSLAQSEVDYSRQSLYSQGENSVAQDFQGEYGADDQSEDGWSAYGRKSDPTNFEKPQMTKGQSFASTLDGSKHGSGKTYAHSLYGNGMSIVKPDVGKWNSEEQGVDFSASLKQGDRSEYYDGGDSYTSDTSFRKQGSGNVYSKSGDSYASSGLSFHKRGGGSEYDEGEDSYASAISIGKQGGSKGGDSYAASAMSLQKPGSIDQEYVHGSVHRSWRGADMTTGYNDLLASGASLRKSVMSSGQSYASFADDEDHEMPSGTLV
ncbi:hypothetical protein MHU86_12749 [Fragilaria crotonensis]|nr:hypothetical protein MHU86_12749 [Fragilaria crotonensis]